MILYIKQQKGRPLTQPQMENLLNQEARNLAAIKTYLLGTYPDTSERYLGQTGMIFAGGIQHCEDFSRQLEGVLNGDFEDDENKKKKYQAMSAFLKKEGIAPVAFLHSKMPKEGIPLTIDGKKSNYTRDQIKELHRQGKILLLVSDKELKEGTDFPRDSIVMELVDRLSVVDTTQRFGRGFRRDPDDKYKRCKVFNLVDENTYDIHKDNPHMLPIYAAEILEGAEFRAPMKRKGLIHRFKNEIPDAPETLQQAGFDVITNIENVREISERYKKRKAELDYPKKTDEWLSKNDTQDSEKVLGGKRVAMQTAVNDLTGKDSPYDPQNLGIQPVKYKGQTIRLQKMKAGTKQPICIFRKDWPKVEMAAGVEVALTLNNKDENWLSSKDTHDSEIICGGTRTRIGEAVNDLTGENSPYNLQKMGVQPVKYKGQTIRLQKMQAGPKQPICIFRKDWPKVEMAAGVEVALTLNNKDENWLSARDTRDSKKLPGSKRDSIKTAVNDLTGKDSPYDPQNLGIQPVKYKGQTIRLQKMKARGAHPICICLEDWSKVEAAAGIETGHGIKPKSIKPDSDDLKRTGRTRSKDEDE